MLLWPAAYLALGAFAAGCGSSSPRAHPTRTAVAGTHARARSVPLHPATPAEAHRRALQARADVSADTIVREGKIHVAAGAPSDAQVRSEIKKLRKAGIVLPSGNTASAFANAPSYEGAAAAGAQTPVTSWNPLLKPIAGWIVPILQWASEHGWHGTVTSGYRTYFEQAQLNAAGAFSARAGLSNHETTVYPGGAVDVTAPGVLLTVLKRYAGPLRLVGGVLGPVDPEHFSATGD
ncbi:MAG TPA: hypothetical protein VFW29_11170 [Solirubrobacteraceae bacterium]|nr:hypothetical protein [Solirubrobacteraceae bacterium]